MKSALRLSIILILGVLIGVFIPKLLQKSLNTDWHSLNTAPNNFGVGYATSVIFGDLPPPAITAMSGKGKFMKNIQDGASTEFGYIINISMDSLDLSKIPQEYKEKEIIKFEGVEINSLPIEQAIYKIRVSFDLKDADGFVLKTISAKEFQIESGKNNIAQDMTEDLVPYATAIKVATIEMHSHLAECLSCKSKAKN